SFNLRDRHDAISVSHLSSLKNERVLFARCAQTRILLAQPLAILFDARHALTHRFNLLLNFCATLFERSNLLLLITSLAQSSITLQLAFGCRSTRFGQLLFNASRFLCRTPRILFTHC